MLFFPSSNHTSFSSTTFCSNAKQKTPFLRWYTPETFRITFSDTSGLNYRDVWQRPHEKLRWEWTSKSPRSILETDANYEPLPDGIRTEELTNGGVTISLKKLTIQTHYYCVTRDTDHCRPEDQYHGRIHMYTASVFRSANVLGNQNYRWTFFVLAALAVFVHLAHFSFSSISFSHLSRVCALFFVLFLIPNKPAFLGSR